MGSDMSALQKVVGRVLRSDCGPLQNVCKRGVEEGRGRKGKGRGGKGKGCRERDRARVETETGNKSCSVLNDVGQNRERQKEEAEA